MNSAYALFLIPLTLYVVAFLYETILSFLRLKNTEAGRTGYVHATWEITHTLLIFALVVMLMLFTKVIDDLGAVMFVPAFLAAVALTIRSMCYIYIFYVRNSTTTSWIDWVFAGSHVAAASLLVLTAVRALLYLLQNQPPANTQFIPVFVPGLIVVVAICLAPMLFLYFTKSSKY
jgi:cytochrome bd-type quinol oxidase subunit 2